MKEETQHGQTFERKKIIITYYNNAVGSPFVNC